MVKKTISFKLDTDLLNQIKIRATEKGVTQSELVTIYLKNALRYDLSEDDLNIIQFLNSQSKNHLDKLKEDFEVPEMLNYDPKKENKPITEENIIFEDEGGMDIFSNVMGFVSSPTRTNSVELKKESYNRS